MFNKRTNARLTCLEIFEEAYRDRMDGLEKEIKQMKCEHKAIIFKEKIETWPEWGMRRRTWWKECADCGKCLQGYDTDIKWLEARLKAEKKTAGKSKKKTTKKAKVKK